MTGPALAAPLVERPLSARRFGAAPTLDAAVSALWTRISSHHGAVCPVCQGQMEPEYGAGALPVAGRCHDCRTVLT